MRARDRLYVALDVPILDEARPLIEALGPEVGGFKVGLELFIAAGPAAVRAVQEAGGDCFLDLKLHDIPATVARSAARAAELGAAYLTLHAASGPAALEAAARAVEGSETTLLAVTVLTSLASSDLAALGIAEAPAAQVERRARLAVGAGVGGLVCSPAECARLKAAFGEAVHLMVPGIRPAGAAQGDQKRVATPAAAVRDGADRLVVGRPIRHAEDPVAAARAVAREVAGVTGEAP